MLHQYSRGQGFESRTSLTNYKSANNLFLTNHIPVNPNSGAFINDNNSLLICHVHDFISIRIVTGSETVCSKPFNQIEVFSNDSIVHTLATNLWYKLNDFSLFRLLLLKSRDNYSYTLWNWCYYKSQFPPCTTGTHISIFMLAKSFKVEWLIVDEKVRSLHLHWSNTHRQVVDILWFWWNWLSCNLTKYITKYSPFF